MRAARKSYDAPLTMSTVGRRNTAKTPAVYYTYDRHGERVELPAYCPQAPGDHPQLAMPTGGAR